MAGRRTKMTDGDQPGRPPWYRRRFTLDADTVTWLFVALGIVLRLLEYIDNRGLYMDEISLLRNLVGKPIFDFSTRLTENQLAPPGFLVIERLMVRLPIAVVWSTRFIPLLCGLASMVVMRNVARAYLTPRGAAIAVGLFALDDWTIYYAVEIKQYSSDILLALGALLLAEKCSAGVRNALRHLAAFGVAGVWFSHPLAIMLGAVGSYLAGEAALRQDWKRVASIVAMCGLWVINFAICYFVSHRILSTDRFIWDWWHFAFLPIPPRSLADAERLFWQLLNVFNSPAWVVTPLGVLGSSFLALGLYTIGSATLARRWPGGLYLLTAPLLLTIAASALHQYPFHGRLLLFLVPSLHMLVGEGAAALTRRAGVVSTVVLGAFLLVQPTAPCSGTGWSRSGITRDTTRTAISCPTCSTTWRSRYPQSARAPIAKKPDAG